jgi:hypothetical protein
MGDFMKALAKVVLVLWVLLASAVLGSLITAVARL